MKIQEKKHYLKRVSDEVLRLKKYSGNSVTFTDALSMLRYSYGHLGECELMLDNDLVAAKQSFYKAARVIELMFENWQGKCHYPQKSVPYLASSSYLTASYLILSDNAPYFKQFFETVQYYANENGGDPKDQNYFTQLALAFKEFAKGDYEKAIPYLNHSFKPILLKMAQYTTGYETVLLGIIHKNQGQIEEGIERNLKYHVRIKHDRCIFPEFSLEATAMTKLAYMYGFKIDVKSPYIHQGLIAHDSTIVYEDIVEVFEALDYKKPWWKLF